MNIKNISKLDLTYYFITGLITIASIGGSIQYLTLNEKIVATFSYEMKEGFNAIGFPSWLIIPMGIAKLSGAIALWAPIPKLIREWAYAGLFFNFILASGSHFFNMINPNDPDTLPPFILSLLVLLSRYLLFKKEQSK
tara:strand:+ start:412 stop:825 length:414 start_codon:yes stop_codon:yes gene_type:complete